MEPFIIGRSRSGKIVTSCPDLDDLGSFEDIFDAMAMLSVLAVREHRRDKNSDLATSLPREVERLFNELKDANQWQAQMDSIQANTSVDVNNHALGLLSPEFKA
jgi:hypothetical protein